MDAITTISTSAGEEILRVHAEDDEPFVVLTLSGRAVMLTREESRRAADALRAAALRRPYRSPTLDP